MRRLIAAIRDNDERKVEEAVLQLARTRRIFVPLALAAGSFVISRRRALGVLARELRRELDYFDVTGNWPAG